MEETSLQFTYTASQEMIRKSNRRYWMRHYIPKKLILDFLAIAIFCYFLISGDQSWRIGMWGTCAFILIALNFATYYKDRNRAMKNLSNTTSKEIKVVLNEECMSIKTDLGSSALPWKGISKVWRFTDFWLVSGRVYFTFPVAVLDEETQAFITNQVLKNNGKIS